MDSSARGRFVVLEGPDGSGKTTQAAHLVEWLRAAGRSVVACRDPGGTALGDRLRAIVQGRSEAPFGMRAEMLLFMAGRAQLVEEVIRPALEGGHIVVSDRYLLSNVVYQGWAGGLEPEAIETVGRVATGGLMPDLTILVDVPLEVARARIGAPRDRIEDRPEAYRERVRRGFLDALQTYPHPSCVIDGSGAPEVIASRIRNEVARALGIGSRA